MVSVASHLDSGMGFFDTLLFLGVLLLISNKEEGKCAGKRPPLQFHKLCLTTR